jgi:hypothetical protein
VIKHRPAVRERINVVAMRQDLLYGNNQKNFLVLRYRCQVEKSSV